MDCPKQPCPSTFTAHFLVAMQRLKRPPRRSASRGNCQSSLLLIWGVAILSLVVLNLTVHLPVPRYNPGVDEAPDAACEVKNKMCTCLFGKSKSWAREVDAADDNSVINLDHGDPTLYRAYWRSMRDRATIVIRGWHTMSYFSNPSNDCWFMEPEFAAQIRRLHCRVGNAVVDGRYLVVGTGSSQLFLAALYALAPPNSSHPIDVVSEVPYYSAYPAITDCLKSRLFRWSGDVNNYKGDAFIELVCSPNNPDGNTRKAVLNSGAGKRIHDFAYYWPQYTPITSPADHDLMLFTVSKATGHAGSRLGWAIVKDREVAKKMIKFIELNTIGVSKDSQLRAAKILKVITDGCEFPKVGDVDTFFDYGRRLMAERWERLREAVKKTGIFSLPDFPVETCNFTRTSASTYPAFAWLKCEKEGIEDCQSFLKKYNILTRNGKQFGEKPTYTRVSMLDHDETFDLLIKRLYSMA